MSKTQSLFEVETGCGTTKEFDSRSDAEDGVDTHVALCEDCTADEVELRTVDNRPDGGTEVVEPEPVPDTQETEVVDPADLSEDPIGFLRSVNSDFVDNIKGTPSISKKGFRFIQREFEISTESEVVQWSDDPLGCVVWAKAELDDGYSAEAHGEGYQFESDVSDNEFVRYADTRAKNRAISDLTSAGALAVSELQE